MTYILYIVLCFSGQPCRQSTVQQVIIVATRFINIPSVSSDVTTTTPPHILSFVRTHRFGPHDHPHLKAKGRLLRVLSTHEENQVVYGNATRLES